MKKSTLGIFILLTFLFLSFSNKQINNFIAEPADPDKQDMEVWKNIKPGVYSGFGSIDVAYPKSIPPAGKISETIQLQGWKGERLNCLMLVWSAGNKGAIKIKASRFGNRNHQMEKGITSICIVKYVLSDEFSGGCGTRNKDKFPVHISPDLLTKSNSFSIINPETRPIWISIDIPSETPAGLYKGIISISCSSGTVHHAITLEVLNKTLPAPSEWTFHLDLWQNPYAVARFHQVRLWSREHISLLRPLLTMLAHAGQKCITTTLIDDPWNGQTFDPYGSMIKWTKKTDGTWAYDYSIFDLYVNLAMESGIKEQINCYSMVPVANKLSWFDERSSETVTMELLPGTKAYEDIWRSFLNDFKAHLSNKGWLDKTAIALDEREEEEMKKMFSFLKETAPELKISMAGFYYNKVNPAIYDFSSNWRHIDSISRNKIVESRRHAGLKSTYYVACGIPKPNNFTFSPPAESCYEGWFASAMGFDGFLRWAYNSWPENPLLDSRFTRWPSGDTYLVYPDAQSSIRFERLREGIQDYEKIKILRKELAENPTKEAAAARERLNIFMGSINANTLIKNSAAEVINDGKNLMVEIVKSVYHVTPKSTTSAIHAFIDDEAPGWFSLTPDDFTKVNSADDTWSWADGVLHCSGQPVSVQRTVKEFGNFEMVVEWMHEKPAGNSGVFVWATPLSIEKLTAAGKPGLPDGIEVQILDHGFTDMMKAKGAKTDWFGTNGDVFAVRVKMTPFPPLSPDGSRSFPRKNLAKGHGEWNHYYIRAINGEVRLWVNGEEVSGGTSIEPHKGYLCLESEGSPIQFRKLRVRELP